jgi:hypothetical protein
MGIGWRYVQCLAVMVSMRGHSYGSNCPLFKAALQPKGKVARRA